MGLPTLDFAQDCRLILPSHEKKMCRERQQKRNRRLSYLEIQEAAWPICELYKARDQCFLCLGGAISSVCSCLLMQGSSSHGLLNSIGQVPWGPTATTLQHLCAWIRLLWLIPAWYSSRDLKKWQSDVLQIHRYITGPCHPRSLGKWSRGMVALSWAKRLKKQLQVVCEGSTTILWHHADLGLSSCLALCYVSTALIINFISKSWLHPVEVWLVSVSQTDNAVVNCREENKCSSLAFWIIF